MRIYFVYSSIKKRNTQIFNRSTLLSVAFLNGHFSLEPTVFHINAHWQRTEQQVFLESRQVKNKKIKNIKKELKTKVTVWFFRAPKMATLEIPAA